jgi:hypothetical protein
MSTIQLTRKQVIISTYKVDTNSLIWKSNAVGSEVLKGEVSAGEGKAYQLQTLEVWTCSSTMVHSMAGVSGIGVKD